MKWSLRNLFETKSAPQTDSDILSLLTGPTPGNSVTVESALGVPAVAAAVRIISESCGTLDIDLVNRNDSAEVIKDHPALDLVKVEANEWTSGFELVRDLVSQALTRDSGGLAIVGRNADGKPVEIIQYRQGLISVDTSSDTGEPVYRVAGKVVPSRDVLHLRGPFYRCPVTLAREAIAAAIVMEAHASRTFKNGARPSGVVQMPNKMSETAIPKAQKSFTAAYAGAENSGRTLFLYDGATFTTTQLTSVDAQFLELRRFQTEEIARGFNMSPSMLGDLTKSSYANAEQKQKEFLAYSLDPWLCALESAFNRVLLTDDERRKYTFRFARDDLTRASLTERATAVTSLIASETINPNTGRNWLGLPSYPGGEVYGNRNINVAPAHAKSPGGANV